MIMYFLKPILALLLSFSLLGCFHNSNHFKENYKYDEKILSLSKMTNESFPDTFNSVKDSYISNLKELYNKISKNLNTLESLGVFIFDKKEIDLAKNLLDELNEDSSQFNKIYAKAKEELGFFSSLNIQYIKNTLQTLESIKDSSIKNFKKEKEIAQIMIKKYPNRKDDILKIISSDEEKLNSLKSNISYLKNLLKTKKITYNDFLKIKNLKNYNITDSNYLKISSLDKTYIKFLAEKKTKYIIQMSCSSWDNYSDYSAEKNIAFPEIIVDKKTYDKYINYIPKETPIKVLLSNISKNDPFGKLIHSYKFPRGHDYIECWTNDNYAEYYFKYRIYTDKVNQNNEYWEEVSPEVYNKYKQYVGLALVSKPKGFFDDEAFIKPHSLGSSLVGDSHYGEWRTNPNGSSFWFWMYAWSYLNNNSHSDSYRKGIDYSKYKPTPNKPISLNKTEKQVYDPAAKTHINNPKNIRNPNNLKNSYKSIRTRSKSNRGRGSGGGGK